MKDPTIAAYAKYAPQYQRMNGISIWNDALLRFKVYVPGGRVLDIGCGTGREYPHFPDPTYTYTGLDASAEMLAIARRNFPSADFQLTDIRHITIPPHSCDGALAIGIYLHFPKAEFRDHLASLQRLLKSRGAAFIAMREGVGEERREDGRYFAYYQHDELVNLLNTTFSVPECYPVQEPDGTKWLSYILTHKP